MVSHKIGFLLLFIIGFLANNAEADFSIASPNIPLPGNYAFQGNGSISAQNITLTLAQEQMASVLYWADPQNVLDGFTTTFTYQSIGCDTIIWSNGADGISLFIAPSINTNEDVSYGGTLGLGEKTNIALLGFVLWQGKIMYTATDVGVTMGTPSSVPSVPADSLLQWRCAGDVSVTVDFTPPSTFRVTAPLTSTDSTITLDITQYFRQPTQHYIGLAAATGAGYMQQSITTWDYKSKVDLVPILECIEALDSGFIAHLGYNNLGVLSTYIDIGPQNTFSAGDPDRGQIKTFAPGRSEYYPNNAFSIPAVDGQLATWTLGNRQVTIDTSNLAYRCPTSLKVSVTFSSPQNLTETQLAAIVQSLADFLQISVTRITVVGFFYGNGNPPPGTKRSIMQADLATLELEISSAGTGSTEPSAAQSVQTFVQSASNTTRMNEVLNPGGVSNVGFVSTGLKPTGSEVNGEQPGTPSTTPVDPSPPTSPPTSPPISPPVVSGVPSASPIETNEPQTTSGPVSAVPIKGATPQQTVDAKSSGYIIMPVYYTVIMFVLYVVAL